MLKVFRISSGVFPLIMLATVLQVTSKSPWSQRRHDMAVTVGEHSLPWCRGSWRRGSTRTECPGRPVRNTKSLSLYSVLNETFQHHTHRQQRREVHFNCSLLCSYLQEVSIPGADVVGPLLLVLVVLGDRRVILVVGGPLDHFLQDGRVNVGQRNNLKVRLVSLCCCWSKYLPPRPPHPCRDPPAWSWW